MRLRFVHFLILLVLPNFSYAILIDKIEKDSVLLNSEGESLRVGEKLVASDLAGKARAILTIKSIKGTAVQAQILKGTIKPEHSITKIGKKTKNTGKKAASPRAFKKNRWATLVGFTSSTMNVRPSASSSVNLAGSSVDLTFLYNRPLTHDWTLKINGKYHTLKVSGPSNPTFTCEGGDCFVDIGYLGAEAIGAYNYLKKPNFELWVGAGLGFFFAMSKSSNILDASTITTNETIILSTGLDWTINKKSFLPLQFDFVIFPESPATSAKQMIFSLGYGKVF